MTRKTVFAAILALALVPTIAIGATYTVRGGGTASCGGWVKVPQDRSYLMSWVLGFMSGINKMQFDNSTAEKVDMLHGADSAAIEVWITNFCTQNPLKDITDASIELLSEIQRNQSAKP